MAVVQQITADTVVAGFRLIEPIGLGSTGEVWSGERDGQIVAVKFLNTTLLGRPDYKKHLRRFHNEAVALRTVSDLPHIPTHIHQDLKVDRPYIIMQFIESIPYSDMMINSEMMYVSLPTRLHALQRIAETLSVIHQRKIIHRDIKPSNIRGLDHPYLLDFSIGMPFKHAETADRRIGTPLYLTPDLLPPSARTDVYAFTVVVYEMLFNRHPIFDYRHVPDNADELRQEAGQAILNETWQRPNQLLISDLPINLQGADLDRLTAVFQNALMLSDDRYADALVFMNDVRDAVLVDSNADYIDLLPLPTDNVGVGQLSDTEHFTDHLVEVYSANTDIPLAVDDVGINTRQWIIGLSLLFGLLFVVLVLLVLAPT